MSTQPTITKAAHAAQLHREGLSLRQASRMAGVSRDTLQRFLAGEMREQGPAERRIRYPHAKTKPRRCKTCRALVYMPCLACQLVEA